MDILTDTLQQAGLHRRLLDLRQLAQDQALLFPCDKSIGLHVVRQGTLYIHTDAQPEPMTLHAGDIALMARGCHHVLSPHPRRSALKARHLAGWEPRTEADGQAPALAVISGAYQLWHPPVHPFFQEMPNWFVLRADTLPKLGPLALTLGLLDDELRQPQLGRDAVVHGLLDVVFSYVLREVVQQGGERCPGWSQGVADPRVRQALSLLHQDCARGWTLEALASEVGMSRTSLAERFRATMNDTPLNYLRTVRMQKAMQLLSTSSHNLEAIAAAVGYQDAFSFSKVFKRTVGVSPKAFRQSDAQARQSPWRVQAS